MEGQLKKFHKVWSQNIQIKNERKGKDKSFMRWKQNIKQKEWGTNNIKNQKRQRRKSKFHSQQIIEKYITEISSLPNEGEN